MKIKKIIVVFSVFVILLICGSMYFKNEAKLHTINLSVESEDLNDFIYINLCYPYDKKYLDSEMVIDKLLLKNLLKSNNSKYNSSQIYSIRQNELIKVSSFVESEYAGITISCTYESVDLACDLLNEMVYSSKFDYFNDESILVEYQSYIKNQDAQKKERVKEEYFIKSNDINDSITVEDLKEYYEEKILSNVLFMYVVGEIEEEEIKKCFSNITFQYKEIVREKIVTEHINNGINGITEDQNIIGISNYKTDSDKDMALMYICKYILKNKLFETFREDESLSYYNNVQIENGDVNVVIIETNASDYNLVFTQLNKMLEELANGDLLQIVRQLKTISTEFYLDIGDNSKINKFMLDCYMNGYDYSEQINKVNNIVEEDIDIMRNIFTEINDNLSLFY